MRAPGVSLQRMNGLERYQPNYAEHEPPANWTEAKRRKIGDL